MPSSLPKKIDVIVHIGAGQGEELNSYLNSSAKRIILVEPSVKLAAELRSRSERDPRVQVLEVAVSPSSGDNQINQYNLPCANSLYPPTGLKKLFPGLRLLGRQAVSTVTGHELLQQCTLISNQNALIVQTPGAELGIIESLTETGGIDQFSYLSVTCSEHRLYDTPSDSAAVLKILQEQGFDLVHRQDKDPDWPQWYFTIHPLVRRLEVEKLKLAAERRKTEKLKKKLALMNSDDAKSKQLPEITSAELAGVQDKVSLKPKKPSGSEQDEIEPRAICKAHKKSSKVQAEAIEDISSVMLRLESSEKIKSELLQDVEKLRNDYSLSQEELKSKQRQLDHLLKREDNYRRLISQQKENMKRLEEELLKAASQLDFIKELTLREVMYQSSD